MAIRKDFSKERGFEMSTKELILATECLFEI